MLDLTLNLAFSLEFYILNQGCSLATSIIIQGGFKRKLLSGTASVPKDVETLLPAGWLAWWLLQRNRTRNGHILK